MWMPPLFALISCSPVLLRFVERVAAFDREQKNATFPFPGLHCHQGVPEPEPDPGEPPVPDHFPTRHLRQVNGRNGMDQSGQREH
jgi:hypothetical protein